MPVTNEPLATRVLLPLPPEAEAPPRWVGVFLTLALAVRVGEWLGRFELPGVWAPMSIAAGFGLGHWAEDQLFRRFTRRAVPVRVTLLLMQVLVWLPLLLLAVLAAVPVVGAVAALAGCFAALWFSSASLGSLSTMVLDLALSRTRTRFRTRLTWAIFGLLMLGVIAGTVAGFIGMRLAQAPDQMGVKLTGSGDQFVRLVDGLKAHPYWVYSGSAFFALLVGAPAMLAASGKLADAAMERVRPLSAALDEVALGKRDVRVEEAGSIDFIELNRRFNSMVKALGDAERMEDAFGRYVSKKVLERIRAQHGQAVIPAQLRNATVFFADVRGYTALSEKLPPEAMVDLLNRYLARVVDLVEVHEGYLNKFIGDAVVVVFNGPVEQLDHAERAVRCAAALQQMVREQNATGAFKEAGELRIGVGIATGPMVCGNVGGPSQMEYTVIGDTVNLSARLTSAAAATEVWVSEATAQACAALQFEALPEMKMKGKEKPVVPYKLKA